jgi:hypothetical protein
LQVGASGSLAARNDIFATIVGQNWFINSSGSDSYIGNGLATFYRQTVGQHQWITAANNTSGAGVALTPTQAMTLDASGNLGVGITNPGFRVDFRVGSTGNIANFSDGTQNLTIGTASGSVGYVNGAAGVLGLYTSGTERARITSGGDLLHPPTTTTAYFDSKANFYSPSTYAPFGGRQGGGAGSTVGVFWHEATSGDNSFTLFVTDTTPVERGSITYNRAGGLVAYNTTSDYRAKDILGPVQNPGTTIDALKVYNGKMKGATVERPMLVAHEAQEVTPYAVTGEKDAVNDDGTPKYQQMDVSSLVPLLIAEIQSLRARVAQLEKGA